jgi:hypothetical protein
VADVEMKMLRLREALEMSWDTETSYRALQQTDVPSYAQCYPTARVVQHYYPTSRIIQGTVWTGTTDEKHFWNVIDSDGAQIVIDFTWSQFPHGSIVKDCVELKSEASSDSETAKRRCALLLQRVQRYLADRYNC